MKAIYTITDTIEEIAEDLAGLADWLIHHASTQRVGKELKAFADEISWLSSDVADICRNGATYAKTYQAMGQLDFFIERLYGIMDSMQADYWRDEIEDNIKRLAGLYAPMMAVMSDAVFRDALYSYSKEL